jgi:hypothetical protein
MSGITRDIRQARNARRHGGVSVLPILVVAALALGAIGFIAFVLWPRWPSAALAPGAPSLPITIAGTAFNVPPAAMRVPVQRRSGAHERVDLAFLWPSLDPPAANLLAPPPGGATAAAKTIERVFVTIAAAGDTLAPAERVKTIYPRYTASEAIAGPDGLAVLAFRDGTPYQGEDLIYEAAAPDRFLVRCSRNAGPTPGTCLLTRRIDAADLVMRFPRGWLNAWRVVDGNIERLVAKLRPQGG